MKMHNKLPFRSLLLAFTLQAQALVQEYCSSENTGAGYSAVTDIYQSNGACHDTCLAQYAFAVVQYNQCWCTNIAPGNTVSVSSCSQACPGYPAEKCGNADTGLFGYVALTIKPSATSGGSTTSPSSTSTQKSTTTAPSATQEPETSYTSTSATPTTSTVTQEPITSVIMTTISGAVVTQTVTSTPVVAPESNTGGQQPLHRSGGISGGAIAGIVIGILAALAAIGAAAFLLWRRRKAMEESESGAPPSTGSGSRRLGRNVSVLSKAGLLNATRPSMSERDDYYGTQATGQNSVRHSLMFGLGNAQAVDPASPLGSSHGSDQTRRTSKPMVYDQRLNPSALFANAEANGSRVSMQDQRDYSRPILGVVNPDPRPSFESRISKP